MSAPPVEHPAAAAPERDPAGPRARFLQLVLDAQQTRLIDNLDPLFAPWGHGPLDQCDAGARLAVELELLERSTVLWDALGDENSRELYLRFRAYRALGPAHVRLDLDPLHYRRGVLGLSARCVEKAGLLGLGSMPFEWQFHLYNLERAGYPLRVVGQQLPLASTFVLSQYAYRDAAAGASPRPGDVALDVGGCWGDTALWLAHMVGPEGSVHTFEPTPRNRDLLARNLSLNPHVAHRITVWEDPLGPRGGEPVWIENQMSAGATVREERDGAGSPETVELRTESIDALVARGALERVDFLKIDVEGADLGVLEGAAATIRAQRPRIAIACYHKPDDLVLIPDYLASLGVEYRWYLQCSTMVEADTVAFAVPAD